MPAVSIAGSQFTVTYNSVAVSAQVIEGTITATPTITRTKTLSDTDFQITDLVHEVEVTFLYDEETGFHGAVNTAAIAGTGVTISIVGGDAKWDGTVYCQGLETSFAADGVATSSGSFIGTLTLADAP